MITAYQVCLFIHISSVFVLAIAMGVAHRAVALMERATTREAALENCKLVLDNGVLFPTATVFVVGSGLYMGLTAWSITAPWIIMSLGFVVVGAFLGFAVMYPRASAIYGRLAALPDGPLPPEASAARRDPVAALLPSALSGNALGTAFVMITKPGWAIALAAFIGFSIAGLVPVWPRAQEAMRERKRARDLARTKKNTAPGKPILCDVLDPKLVVVETTSPFTLKAHKALLAAGVDYITRRSTQPGDYKHLNPKGQLPVLIVGDEIICGSRAIVRRCAEWAPHVYETALSPENEAENHFWEEYSENTLKGFVAYSRWADEENWERAKAAYFVDMPVVLRPIIIPNVRKAILRGMKSMDVGRGGAEEEWQRYLMVLDMLERRAPREGYWLGTPKLAPCDISLYAFLQCMRTAITPAYHQALLDHPALNAYLDRVEALTKVRHEDRPPAAISKVSVKAAAPPEASLTGS